MKKTFNESSEMQKITSDSKRIPIVETNAPEQIDLLTSSETGIITATSYQLDGKTDLELWFHAIDEDISTPSALDVTFYRMVAGVEIAVETVPVNVPVTITAGTVARVAVKPSVGGLASYTSFMVSGTITLETDGIVSLTAYLRNEAANVEITDGTNTLDILEQNAAFGTATKGVAIFGKYQATPTAYDDGDAVPLLLDANGRLVLNSDIQIGAVELKDATTDSRADINDADTARTTGTKVLAVQHIDDNGDVLLQSTQEGIETNQTDGSQKTQIVDGSGDVISSTSNALDVNVKSNTETLHSVPAKVDVSDTETEVAIVNEEIINDGDETVFINTVTGVDTDDFPLYPGQSLGKVTGTIFVICDTGLTSTLRRLKFA